MNNEELSKVESPMMREAASLLMLLADKILSGECMESDITYIMSKVHPYANSYVSDKELCNVDECCKLLQLGYNRNKFYQLAHRYGIRQVVINNRKCGFRRDDIIKIKNLQKGNL